MRSGVIAQKVGMTRVYNDAGEHVPVTVLKVENLQVVAQRTQEKNGYTAVQLGAGLAKVKNTSKALRGVFAQASVEPKRKVAEFRVSEDALIPVANAADYLRALPHATLVRLPGIGHVPQEEAPDASLEPVKAFLAR